MANERNLIPFTKRTPEEHRELSRKGGLASGEVRRQKRAQRIELMNSICAIKGTASMLRRTTKNNK